MEDRMREYIKVIASGSDLQKELSPQELQDAFEKILRRDATDAQIGAFLIALRMKEPSADDILCGIQTFRKFSTKIDPKVEGLVEICPPHDGKIKSWPFYPFAAIIASAAGVPVLICDAKKVPIKFGLTAADIYEKLDICINLDPKRVERTLSEVGIGYLYDPVYFPLLEDLKDIRASLGLRTIINTIEKVMNPAHAKFSLVGAFHGKYLNYLPEIALKDPLTGRTIVCQGSEGTSDLYTAAKTKLFDINKNGIQELEINPADFGLKTEDELGFENVALEEVLKLSTEALSYQGEEKIIKGLVLNSALILYLSGKWGCFADAVHMTQEVMRSQAPLKKLLEWRDLSNQLNMTSTQQLTAMRL